MLIRPVTKEERLQSAQLLTIESGDLTISAADDAIHCDYTLQIGAEGTDGPAISITDCDEGLEAAALHVASGDIRIRASDDCLNAANSDLSGFDFSMDISGGTPPEKPDGGTPPERPDQCIGTAGARKSVTPGRWALSTQKTAALHRRAAVSCFASEQVQNQRQDDKHAANPFGGEGELRVEALVLVLTEVGITAAAGDGAGQTCGLAGLDRHDDDEADGQNDLNDR